MNIVILEGQVNNPGDLSWDALDRFGTVTVYDRTSRDQLKTRVAEADIVVSSKTEWNAEALGWAPRLKMIALTSTGYNVVDLDAARDAGVIVSNVPAYSTPDVAQMTFALLLELCLHVGEHSNLVMEGDWTRAKDFSFWNTPLVELAGKTMGIVGMGSIGQAVCRIARAFGMPVVFENRSAKPQLESDGVRQVSLDELLAVSDVVTLHAPATPETDRMMNAQTIGRMKDGAYLLNTARGTLVDEQAVVDALRSGKLAGFAADVVSVEPMQPDNPLLQAKGQNIIVTPHIAWATHEARERLLATVTANVGAFVEGAPQNVVNQLQKRLQLRRRNNDFPALIRNTGEPLAAEAFSLYHPLHIFFSPGTGQRPDHLFALIERNRVHYCLTVQKGNTSSACKGIPDSRQLPQIFHSFRS